MDVMPDTDRAIRTEPLDWAEKFQLHGTLQKRPYGHNSNKWSKRFFLVKDGYLFYYAENERKELEKRHCLNIHPKGVIPLSECTIKTYTEATHPFAFSVEGDMITGRLQLAAENEFERAKWMKILEKAQRITWKNANVADDMIRQLEEKGLQMANQKQDYFDRLQSEVRALSDEKERSEELEKINLELAKEKDKMEQLAEQMRDEYSKVKEDLDEMVLTIQTLEGDRKDLSDFLDHQQQSLQSLEKEKEKILRHLKEQANVAKQLSKENQKIAEHREGLQSNLQEIEKSMQNLLQEKATAEEKLRENEEKAQQLKQEKQEFNEHALELQAELKDLAAQKEQTEAELKEEVMARMTAERRLKEAEVSLHKLDHAVNYETPNIEDEVKESMVVNVKKLKTFFEDLATEARIDADKSVVVKNAVHARKTMRRKAKNKKFESRRLSNRNRTGSMEFLREDKKQLPRRAVTMIHRGSRQDDGAQNAGNCLNVTDLYL